MKKHRRHNHKMSKWSQSRPRPKASAATEAAEHKAAAKTTAKTVKKPAQSTKKPG